MLLLESGKVGGKMLFFTSICIGEHPVGMFIKKKTIGRLQSIKQAQNWNQMACLNRDSATKYCTLCWINLITEFS